MRLHLAISAILLTVTQAAPSSYLEKAKAILSRAIFPCTDYDPQNCLSSGPVLDQAGLPSDIPTETYWIENSAQTVPNPVPATAPEVASDTNSMQTHRGSLSPASYGNEMNGLDKDDNPPDDDDDEPKNAYKPPTATCYDYNPKCLLCWDSSDGSRKCNYVLPRNGKVCTKETDPKGKPICADAPTPGR